MTTTRAAISRTSTTRRVDLRDGKVGERWKGGEGEKRGEKRRVMEWEKMDLAMAMAVGEGVRGLSRGDAREVMEECSQVLEEEEEEDGSV